ncbi:hypothetical protein Belba_2215 [Belliella baltica DSM 15883]|uniref:Uncharacterized protein n=1 Tax=Belliella baltica (strain DSM 15883 / CIP 108006 / LMG 21964 / BA134) TaxID=866536 RepID=I3Z6B3_BELBD|nr:hypothetical protein [Belliella baltica]AFL84781.1 hypothetical protein Belba_2215 [Belliella baltica DSM 15883]
MENLRELSFEEMVEVDGGFILWSPSISMTEFVYGISETFSETFEQVRKTVKYEK